MDPQKLGRRIERFLIFRLAAIPMAFILVAICRASLAPPLRDQAFRFLYGFLGAYTLLALGALLLFQRVKRREAFVISQVSIDFAAAAILVGWTGGVQSVFCPFLFATLFNASTVLRGGGVILFASLSTLFLALTTLGSHLWDGRGIVPWGRDRTPPAEGVSSHLVAQGLALHAVALLGTRLSRGLQRIQSIQAEIIEGMAEGLVAVDGGGMILELNGEARRIFGIPGDCPGAGSRADEVFRGDSLQEVREAFRAGERRRFEFSLERPGGQFLALEAKISRVAGEGGRRRYTVGLFVDLSLKKEVERAEARIHKLEELYAMALGIAHEIRNPLASIQGCAQEISRLTQDGAQEQKLLEIICRESARLDRIIEDFMSNARRSPAELRPVDLIAVAEETVIQLRNHPEAGRCRFILERPAASLRIRGDAERLKQVFLNLGTNAIEAARPDGGEIRVSFQEREFLAMNRRRAGERRMVPGVEVRFADNGPGIPEELKNLVFTPFFTTKERGHGLGLAVVHRIVRDHLGTVDVESEAGRGTIFRVWFPLLEGEGIALGAAGRDQAALAANRIASGEVARV